jgi:hypothetical protein
MKKMFLILMSCVFCLSFCQNAFGYAKFDYFKQRKSPKRILYGAVLILGGAFLSYDGFRTVEIEEPSQNFNISGDVGMTFTGVCPPLSYSHYTVDSSGYITNNSRYILSNVTIHIAYQFAHGVYPNALGVPVSIGNLSVGEERSWKAEKYEEWASITGAPSGNMSGKYENGKQDKNDFVRIITVTGYKPEIIKTKKETNNIYEGVAGVLLVGAGIYIIADYFISINRYDYWLKKHNIDFYVTNTQDELKLNLAKRI